MHVPLEVSSLEKWETKCVAESVAEATDAVAEMGDAGI